MNNKKDIIETGWNFDNSYSLLPRHMRGINLDILQCWEMDEPF